MNININKANSIPLILLVCHERRGTGEILAEDNNIKLLRVTRDLEKWQSMATNPTEQGT